MWASAPVQNRSPPSESLWHKPLVSGTDNVEERRGNFSLKPWVRMHELLWLVLQKSQPPPCGWADPLQLWESSVQEVSVPAGAVQGGPSGAPFLFAWCLQWREGGAGVSALVGSWLIVIAVQDVWEGVSVVLSYLCSQTLCLCVDTADSVWLWKASSWKLLLDLLWALTGDALYISSPRSQRGLEGLAQVLHHCPMHSCSL